MDDCGKLDQGGGYCRGHEGGKRCQVGDSTKSSQGGGQCYFHSDRFRCTVKGCEKWEQAGGKCVQHGGGTRCKDWDSKGHGGGSRFQVGNCDKVSISGGKCSKHGGGSRCTVQGCDKSSRIEGQCIGHFNANVVMKLQESSGGNIQTASKKIQLDFILNATKKRRTIPQKVISSGDGKTVTKKTTHRTR